MHELLRFFSLFDEAICLDFTNLTNPPPFLDCDNFQHDQVSKISSERSGTPKKRKAPPPPISPTQVKTKVNQQ